MSAFEKLIGLLQNPEVSEVMINSPQEIFYEIGGKIKPAEFQFSSGNEVLHFIKGNSTPTGGRGWEGPIVSARMKDGSRVHAVLAPVTLASGPSVTIRKFLASKMTLKSLVKARTLSDEMAFFLNCCITARLNIIVCGGTSSGKTTLLNALSTAIDPEDRIISIEDTAELKIRSKNIVRLECQWGQDKDPVTLRDLVRSSLRMRPDRIIVGETRGEEAFDMLQAMNTGHEGSMTTVHGNSTRDCLTKIETMSMLANVGLPLEAIRKQISSAIDIVIHLAKQRDGLRRIVSISEVGGMEGHTILTQEIFRYEIMGEAPDKTLLGKFAPAGVVPRCLNRFAEKGVEFPSDFFSGFYHVDMDINETQKLPVRKK